MQGPGNNKLAILLSVIGLLSPVQSVYPLRLDRNSAVPQEQPTQWYRDQTV